MELCAEGNYFNFKFQVIDNELDSLFSWLNGATLTEKELEKTLLVAQKFK